MINDNILADRLNLFREGEIEETPEEEINNQEENYSNFSAFLFEAIEIGTTFLHSLAFGYAAKIIFDTNWNFLAFLTVGFTIQIILSNTFNLFKQKN